MVSKVGVSALTRIQQRAFDADPREDLVVNCAHPGYVDTDMTSHKVGYIDYNTKVCYYSLIHFLAINMTLPKPKVCKMPVKMFLYTIIIDS